MSNNINESKKRNIFLSEYEVNPNPYNINDTLKIKVLNAWVDNQWGFGATEDETIVIKDKYQLIIEVAPNTLQNYGLTWRIGIDGDKYIRSCGKNCLISSFNQPPQDVEIWQVQSGGALDSISKKTGIGFFKLLRKKH